MKASIVLAEVIGRDAFLEEGTDAVNPFHEHGKLWYSWSKGYGDAARKADGGTGHRGPRVTAGKTEVTS